eukprot:CAMPEP_0172567640 /NCGR_PEP_ID=MMETSP1067-20121228/116648_1 /TAXON_ID=265564 ORGANISM="Thalassiosira punctigera, Strain Tpunct2005C2" /NCGR_SAMPLE_ID=MMETSP1067 /ASSEMBLY_ACC=CAM_ASM_000444 /LENGTH=583 /DNA_ID=CAMNT_0013359043 /DNA_START=35 /DNA_END=1786 /DNA_ORIENTATION=+
MTSIQVTPNDGESDNVNANVVEADDPVIENISALNTSTNNEGGDAANAEPFVVVEDLSLSSATSATSVASALSDGAPRPRSNTRPTNGTPLEQRPNSTPRSRPRSNPRTRTPMRRESPLLVTGRVDDVLIDANSTAVETANNNETLAASVEISVGDETAVRNIFHTRRHRSGSIPEEEEEVAAAESNEPTTSSRGETANHVQNSGTTAATTTNPAPRAAGHWLARAAATVANPRNNRPANPTRSRMPASPSEKQRPSHRKIRRWNNDRFVGTSSEHTHVALQEKGGVEEGDLNWREYYMPHYPLEYRSEFAKLSVDDSKSGRSVRDRFVKGEVARRHGGHKANSGRKEDPNWMERSVVAKFKKLGVSVRETSAGADDGANVDEMGKQLFRALSPRIQSVLSRSCLFGTGGFENCQSMNARPFASLVVAAVESYLVSLALAASKSDVTSGGYPPRQPQHLYDLFDKILVGPPRVVVRDKNHRPHGVRHPHAALIPTVHFHFPTDDAGVDGGKDAGRARSSAFHRILLYAVCQFHGLESSSSVVIAPNGKRWSERGDRREEKAKVVTVQGGVMLAPALKLLDCVE